MPSGSLQQRKRSPTASPIPAPRTGEQGKLTGTAPSPLPKEAATRFGLTDTPWKNRSSVVLFFLKHLWAKSSAPLKTFRNSPRQRTKRTQVTAMLYPLQI